MTAKKALEGVLKLSLDERKHVAHELIESIVLDDLSTSDVDDDEFEITPELIAELDRIDRDITNHPERLVSLEEFEARLGKVVN